MVGPSIAERLRQRTRALYALRPDRTLIAAAGLLEGAVALEPGGPSVWFGRKGLMPVYPRLASLDTLDYAEHTLWSDAAQAQESTLTPVRRRLIGEAARLENVPDDSYDAVLSSHVLEHLANPLGALAEWRRVVRPQGHVLLIVPHRDGTFDHRRPVTSLEHLREDAEHETSEDDLTHLEEMVLLHDLERDPGCPDRETLERRCRDVAFTRAIHHHIFVSRTVVQACEAAELEVVLLRPKLPFNIVCLCRVGEPGGSRLSESELSMFLRRSPFASDRKGTL